jgi:hypothetical protein
MCISAVLFQVLFAKKKKENQGDHNSQERSPGAAYCVAYVRFQKTMDTRN